MLALQTPRSDEHDEMLFIVVHQVYELWFKQILHEIGLLKRALLGGERPVADKTLRRILTILKTLVAQIDVLETMSPVDFLSFRERLTSASGFQSVQFRELEYELGLRERRWLRMAPEGSEQRRRLEARLAEPSVWDAFVRFLQRAGYRVPDPPAPGPEAPEHPQPSEPLQGVLVEIYRTDPDTTSLCERLVDLDEGLQEWRYRHVKMVERTIGRKRGTGGSSGAAYLRRTLFQPLFPDLWAIRTEL
ncbi:MAG: tryptophan 2,3-dioxygenase [Planctomycetota bacterium]|nr:MAG: tryptophan 2,3-dioxygenase [Planctomycetota bacterium]